MLSAETALRRCCLHFKQKCPRQSLGVSGPVCERQRRASSSAPRASANDDGTLEPPNVRYLAKLAQMHVTDEEVADWEPKIRDIVKWFDQLQKIDVEGVEPCTRSSLANLLAARKDVPEEFQNREGLLEDVPDREGPYVKVPKIL